MEEGLNNPHHSSALKSSSNSSIHSRVFDKLEKGLPFPQAYLTNPCQRPSHVENAGHLGPSTPLSPTHISPQKQGKEGQQTMFFCLILDFL